MNEAGNTGFGVTDTVLSQPRSSSTSPMAAESSHELMPEHMTLPLLQVRSGSKRPLRARADELWTLVGFVASLSASAMGTCVLALPIAVYYGGAVVGTGMLLGAAFLTDRSLVQLVSAAQLSESYSYEDLAGKYLGPAGRRVSVVALVLLLLGACTTVLVVMGDLGTQLAETAYDHFEHTGGGGDGTTEVYPVWMNRKLMMLNLLALVMPLCTFEKLTSLGATSSTAVLSIIVVAVMIMSRFKRIHQGVELTPSSSVSGIGVAVLAVPIQSMAFCCHFNVIAVERELKPHLRHLIYPVIHFTIGSIAIFYAAFGLTCYLMFGPDTGKYQDILTAFKGDSLISVGSACVLLTNCLKLPLVFIPLRTTLRRLLIPPPPAAPSLADVGFAAREGRVDVAPPEAQHWSLSITAHLTGTLATAAVIYVLALVCHNLSFAIQVLGASSGIAVAFIFPGVFYHCAINASRDVDAYNHPIHYLTRSPGPGRQRSHPTHANSWRHDTASDDEAENERRRSQDLRRYFWGWDWQRISRGTMLASMGVFLTLLTIPAVIAHQAGTI